MSDTFWTLAFGVIALIVKDLLDWWRSRRLAIGQKVVVEKLDLNTAVTEQVVPVLSLQAATAIQVATKVASDSKEAEKKTAIASAQGQERLAVSVKELAKTIQGDDGTCVTARLKKLEDGHENLSKGQDELSRKMDALAELLKAVDSTVRKSSNF